VGTIKVPLSDENAHFQFDLSDEKIDNIVSGIRPILQAEGLLTPKKFSSLSCKAKKKTYGKRSEKKVETPGILVSSYSSTAKNNRKRPDIEVLILASSYSSTAKRKAARKAIITNLKESKKPSRTIREKPYVQKPLSKKIKIK
jgi:hypothetical protein